MWYNINYSVVRLSRPLVRAVPIINMFLLVQGIQYKFWHEVTQHTVALQYPFTIHNG
uniref:Uncharacterized protein n=1 Tax=Anguilla anguilla TaxID=7936 RepID=A0A0E9WNH7_ANGAN